MSQFANDQSEFTQSKQLLPLWHWLSKKQLRHGHAE